MSSEQAPLHACAGLTAEQLNSVVGLITATDVIELDVTIGATRLSLRRPATASSAAASSPSAMNHREPQSLAIASPLVGIFRPSVSVGETVNHGQTIGAVEALGMPTHVEAPDGGIVEEVVASNGEAVEYGQPLIVLRRIASGAAHTPGRGEPTDAVT